MDAVRQRVAGGERRQRRVPGRRTLPARRPVLRRTGPPARRRRGRDRRQHPSLRARRGERRCDPARARRRRVRRGARARRRDERHRRHRDRTGTVHHARRCRATDHRGSATDRLDRRDRRVAAGRDQRVRRPAPDHPAAGLGAGRAHRCPAPPGLRQRGAGRHLDRRRGREAAQVARPDAARQGDRATRRGDRRPSRLCGVRVRLAGVAAPRTRTARRRTRPGRRRVVKANRGAHQRDDPLLAAGTRRDAGGLGRCRRRRQPVRLRRELDALLRDAHAEPEQ